MKYFNIKYATLFTSRGNKILDIPAHSILDSVPESKDVSTELTEELFKTRTKDYVGWIYSDYLEPLSFEFPENVVESESQTTYPYDAAQYIIWRKNIQYNLCGEFCVAHVFGKSIDEFLIDWESKSPVMFNRVFKSGWSQPTGVGELKDMVGVYEGDYKNLEDLRDQHGKYIILSPMRLMVQLKDWKLILGCKISGASGELQPTGISHWVVVLKVIPDGFGGWVEVYNPFPNRVERYSWRELIKSVGIPYGLFVRPHEKH